MKITIEKKRNEFIKRVKDSNPSYIINDIEDFKNYHSIINITCSIHNSTFTQAAQSCLKYNSCRECLFIKKTNTSNTEFINKANIIHNNFYIYDKTIFKGYRKLVEIKCSKHGYFKQKAGSHLEGHGCKYCSIEKTSGGVFHTKEKMIERFKNFHGDLYDYSNIHDRSYNVDKIKIICKKHGPFY